MLIGINPGAGWWNWPGSPFPKGGYNSGAKDPCEFLLTNPVPHMKDIRDALYTINRLDALCNTFKTKCYFWATVNSQARIDLFAAIGRADPSLGSQIGTAAQNWIQAMVTDLTSKLIICEGVTAFNTLIRFYRGGIIASVPNAPASQFYDTYVAPLSLQTVRHGFLAPDIEILGFPRAWPSANYANTQHVTAALRIYSQHGYF